MLEYLWLWITIAILLLFTLIAIISMVISSHILKKNLTQIKESNDKIDVILARQFDNYSKILDHLKKAKLNPMDLEPFLVNDLLPKKEDPMSYKQQFSYDLHDRLVLLLKLSTTIDKKAELTQLENQAKEIYENLLSARRVYNSMVSIFNKNLISFPLNIANSFLKLSKEQFFEIDIYKFDHTDN